MDVVIVAVGLLVAVAAAFVTVARCAAEELHGRTSHLRRRQLDAVYRREEWQ